MQVQWPQPWLGLGPSHVQLQPAPAGPITPQRHPAPCLALKPFPSLLGLPGESLGVGEVSAPAQGRNTTTPTDPGAQTAIRHGAWASLLRASPEATKMTGRNRERWDQDGERSHRVGVPVWPAEDTVKLAADPGALRTQRLLCGLLDGQLSVVRATGPSQPQEPEICCQGDWTWAWLRGRLGGYGQSLMPKCAYLNGWKAAIGTTWTQVVLTQ